MVFILAVSFYTSFSPSITPPLPPHVNVFTITQMLIYNITKQSEKEQDPEGNPTGILQQVQPAPKKADIVLSNTQRTNRCLSFHSSGGFLLSSNDAGEISVWKIERDSHPDSR